MRLGIFLFFISLSAFSIAQEEDNWRKKRADSLRADAIQLDDSAGITQSDSTDSAQVNNIIGILVGSDTLFKLGEAETYLNTEQRSQVIQQRIDNIIEASDFFPDSISSYVDSNYTYILYIRDTLVAFSESDLLLLKGANKAEKLERIIIRLQQKITAVRQLEILKKVALQILISVLFIVLAFFIYRYTNRLFRYFQTLVRVSNARVLQGIRYGEYELLSRQREKAILQFLLTLTKYFFFFIILYFGLPAAYSLFPNTSEAISNVFATATQPIRIAFDSIIDYIPNLLTIAIIIVATHYLIQLLKYFAREIRDKKLEVVGFHPEWATPTLNILRIIIFISTFSILFPFLPGSNNTFFQVILVFVAVSVAIGAHSTVKNAFAGAVLIYMRSFKTNDRVIIDNIKGQVKKRNLLITRLQTLNNEEVTIPNSKVFEANITNLSESERLVINTKIELPYRYERKEVQQALIRAGRNTEGVQTIPPPYVLLHSLNKAGIEYELNVYVDLKKSPSFILSELNANILDELTERNISLA